MTASDLVVDALAADLAACQARLDAMTDVAADLALELYALRREFLRILKFADKARITAQQERDAVLAQRDTEAAA